MTNASSVRRLILPLFVIISILTAVYIFPYKQSRENQAENRQYQKPQGNQFKTHLKRQPEEEIIVSSNPSIMRAPALFVSHGGGPLPLLNVPDHQKLSEFLLSQAPALLNLTNSDNKPKALAVVTAHWETKVPTVSTREDSKLYFDYYGFPRHTYDYTYNASGDPILANHIAETLEKAGFSSVKRDSERGWDHGVFVPLKLIAPSGLDIPLIMLSVLQSQNPTDLIRLGKGLASLRDEGIALLGSGTTFHNFDGLFAPPSEKKIYYDATMKFEDKLNSVLTSASTDRDTKLAELSRWQSWPNAAVVQPVGKQDHFSPLVVLAGTMASTATRVKLLELSELPASCWTFD